jgi:hypothetical protein
MQLIHTRKKSAQEARIVLLTNLHLSGLEILQQQF